MLQWIYRGLSKGRVTISYPGPGTAAAADLSSSVVVASPGHRARVAAACEAGAIVLMSDGAAPLAASARGLRRSIHVRHIDCGSDGSEEWEIQALWNPYYDIQRLGFFLTNSPRHADVLLVTGPVTAAMRTPLERTWEVMPAPKALVAVGSDACGTGLHRGDATPPGSGTGGPGSAARIEPLTAGGVDQVLPVDVYIPGEPPAPTAIMQGLLLAAGVLKAGPLAAPTGQGRAA